MGIEISTYISGLTATWPPSGDPKSQGDDHLRLIKGVLQATFPSATKAFYFPKGEAASTTMVLDATDQNNVLFITTTSGDVPITLPTGFVAADAGWSCEIVKITGDANAAVVSPPSGTIISPAGATATIRVGAYCQPARFTWTGSAFMCSKPGPMVGSTINWDGAAVPYGCLALDGSVYSSTTFAELFATLASTTLKDKRGRAEIGSGTGAGLTARVLGTAYGAETFTLGVGNLPAQTPAGTIANGAITVNISATGNGSIVRGTAGGSQYGGGVFGLSDVVISGSATQAPSTFTGAAMPGQIATPVQQLQPSVATQKIIRAC
jgi:hypothetical protein